MRDHDNNNYPCFQVWRLSSGSSTTYNKIGEVQLQSDDQVTLSGRSRIANIIFTGNNTIEVQSGDVVGYYHPPEARYRVRTIQSDEFRQYQLSGSHESVNLNHIIDSENDLQQPLIQFSIGKCVYSTSCQLLSLYLLSLSMHLIMA